VTQTLNEYKYLLLETMKFTSENFASRICPSCNKICSLSPREFDIVKPTDKVLELTELMEASTSVVIALLCQFMDDCSV